LGFGFGFGFGVGVGAGSRGVAVGATPPPAQDIAATHNSEISLRMSR
jgi:hypothetical protein